MKLGYIQCADRGQSDRILHHLATALRPRVMSMTAPDADNGLMLHLWPDNIRVDISQNLGTQAGCTLDAGALEQAVAVMQRALDHAPAGTPLIVNKFGKREAEGHGARSLIADALSRGHPVILAVPAPTDAAFHAFAPDLGQKLSPDFQSLMDYLDVTRR